MAEIELERAIMELLRYVECGDYTPEMAIKQIMEMIADYGAQRADDAHNQD